MVMKEMSFQIDDFLRPSKENVRLEKRNSRTKWKGTQRN